jgi:hypothetical protein
MATEERKVTIVAWPKEPALLEHRFTDKPCRVSVSFEEKPPAHVVIETSKERPFFVDMDMKVTPTKTIPVCLKVCEPICIKSDYTIGVDIFDRPVANIKIRGLTRVYNCKEEEEKYTCVDFTEFKPGQVFNSPWDHEELRFRTAGNTPLKTVSSGSAPSITALGFPNEGIRVEFPWPVRDVLMTVASYAGRGLTFLAYADGTLIGQQDVEIHNEVKEVLVEGSGITAIEVKGGGNESSILRICFWSSGVDMKGEPE